MAMAQQGVEWHSKCGKPDQSVNPDNIEPCILPLVVALNDSGFVTRASCQGHLTVMGLSTTYVAFNVQCLDNAERFDCLLNGSKLLLPWNLEARFGVDRKLCWRLYVHKEALKPQPPIWFTSPFEKKWLSKYRASMNKDIQVIIKILESLR